MYVMHRFAANQTIHAIIKRENNHSVTDEELVELMRKFNELNGCEVPKLNKEYKIPLARERAKIQALGGK